MPKDIMQALADGLMGKVQPKDRAFKKEFYADCWYVLDGHELSSVEATRYLMGAGFSLREIVEFKVSLRKEAGLEAGRTYEKETKKA